MRNLLILICIILTLSRATNAGAYELDGTTDYIHQSTHELVIDAHGWESVPIQCYSGDTLSGEFRISHNGELFPGDQTEYDNWLLDGIDLFIFDEENYNLWVNSSPAASLLECSGIDEFTWSIEIPYNDVWYVVYSNDSIFMKEIEGSIVRSGENDQIFTLIALIGIAAILTLTIILWKKK